MGRTFAYEVSIEAYSCVQITKDLILRTEYEDQHRIIVAVYEVPLHIIGENLAAYFSQYGQIRNSTSDNLKAGGIFGIMLDRLTFVSILNSLKFCSCNMPVIVNGSKPTCWKCRDTGCVSFPCPEKKAFERQAADDPNPPLVDTDSSACL